jgi:hypothetical protein
MVTLIYFDSDTLVKLLVQEEGSDLAAELRDGRDAAFATGPPWLLFSWLSVGQA